MTTKQFVESAIGGGLFPQLLSTEEVRPLTWTFDGECLKVMDGETPLVAKCLAELLLDPKVWEAVGRSQGWSTTPPQYMAEMHGLIDDLTHGSTIDQSLETL